MLRSDLRVVPAGEETVLVDRYGLRPPTRLSSLEFAVCRSFAADRSIDATRRAIAREHGVALSRAELAKFRRELVAAAVLEGGPARRDRATAWQRALIEGTLVLSRPRSADQQHLLCATLLAEARAYPRLPGRLEGVLSPHGDLEVTGACAARAYAMLDRETWPEVFVIVGTSHYARAPSLLVRDVQTALGRVRCDHDLAEALRAREPRLRVDAPEFLIEHSWAQDLPLLQTIAAELDRPLRIVAILIGEMSQGQACRLGRDLRAFLFHQFKRGCLVASGDLTHYGEGYGFNPTWLAPSTVRQVSDDIAAREAPLLAAIERRDIDAFSSAVDETSFCARAQVSALMAFAGDDGRLLARRTVLNWQPLDDAHPDRAWHAEDKLFNGAAIAFRWGGGGARRLCGGCIWHETRDEIELLHRCDVSYFGVPRKLLPLVRELARGFSTVTELHSRLGPLRAELDEGELTQFVEQLQRQGLFHDHEPPSHRPSRFVVERAEATIADARASVPFYQGLRSSRLRDAPVLHKEGIRASWSRLFARDVTEVAPSKLIVRTSSSSSGVRPLVTVVEARAHATRRFGELLVRGDGAAFRALHLNRPANLRLEPGVRGWPAQRREEQVLAMSPGPNPSAISDEVWARALHASHRFDPESIEGDPAYVASFAHACLTAGAPFSRLRRVTLGSSYAWRSYLEPIRRAFPEAELVLRYHSSELGEMGLSCEAGVYHLNETRMCFEILDRGGDAHPGGTGALVATTLDSHVRPLVRYVIGDLVQLVAPACSCGAPFRTVHYLGRMAELFTDRRGRWVSSRELDETMGSPPGLRFFRLHIAASSARMEVCAERSIFDEGSVKASLEQRIGRKIRFSHRDHLDVPPQAKLLSIVAPNRSSRWTQRFLKKGNH